MAPGKKKKKVAANPARAPTTVSLPSKSKVDGQRAPDVVDLSGAPEEEQDSVSCALSRGSDTAVDPSSQHAMTPEEFENHLADAELQSVLDTHGQRAKREATRQITRLQTERRVLRSQTMYLDTEDWLTHEDAAEVIDLYNGEHSGPIGFSPDPEASSEELPQDLLVKLWTVQRVLQHLKITRADEILEHLISVASDIRLDSKDYIWGLEEALEWLARTALPGELPRYDTVSLASQIGDHGQFVQSSSSESDCLPSSLPGLPANDRASAPEAVSSRTTECTADSDVDREPEPHLAASQSDTNDDSDDDNDPASLVSKYVEAKSRLLLDDLFFKGKERAPDGGGPKSRLTSLQTTRLGQKVQAIERDILFDHEEAAVRWQSTLQHIQAVNARPKQTNGGKSFNPFQAMKSPEDDVETASKRSMAMINAEESEAGLFGDLFTEIEQPRPEETRKLDPEPDAAILIQDFGKWTGIQPRRVLEEVCRAR